VAKALDDEQQRSLRGLPAVDVLLQSHEGQALLRGHPRPALMRAVRAALADSRAALLSGAPGVAAPTDLELWARVRQRLLADLRPGVERAINATGVVLHPGLGRAPLAPEAQAALAAVCAGYATGEVDRESGGRGVREAGVARLLCELTGAEAATVVNNNAGACLLSLAALAAGREVIVSRGQLVEIGGSFRIPDVMAASGARLVEVGATNRTHLRDYARAISPETAAILVVHRSNFRIVGFTGDPPLEALSELARSRGLLLLEDLGSGNLAPLEAKGLPAEPVVFDRLRAGVDLAAFSGDKLLGGPQAGILVGRRELIARCRSHSLFRALRPGKLTLAPLEATLRLYLDHDPFARVPALAMLTATPADLRVRAEALAAALAGLEDLDVAVVPSEAQAGSGALPAHPIPSVALRLTLQGSSEDAFARALRLARPPVFSRVVDGAFWLDLRTVLPAQDEALTAAVRAGAEVALRSTPPEARVFQD